MKPQGRQPPTKRKCSYLFDEKSLKKYKVEFNEVARVNFIPYLERLFASYPQGYREKVLADYQDDYAVLRSLGYDKVAELMQKLMMDNPVAAPSLFSIFSLVAVPTTSPIYFGYGAIANYEKSLLTEALNTLRGESIDLPHDKIQQVTLPSEIGRYMMQKFTYLPESYEASLSVMDKFQQQDIHKLMNALQIGAKSENIDAITSSGKELSEAFDTLWKDANNVAKLQEGISYGFAISIGIVGALATLPAGGIGGLLSGLGFKVLEDKIVPSLSGKLAKLISPNHLVTIHDFKSKYSLKK